MGAFRHHRTGVTEQRGHGLAGISGCKYGRDLLAYQRRVVGGGDEKNQEEGEYSEECLGRALVRHVDDPTLSTVLGQWSQSYHFSVALIVNRVKKMV